jgi:hypothetical protein
MEQSGYFSSPPQRVFAALIHLLAAKGRVERIEGLGTEVVFRPARYEPTCALRATVDPEGTGTILTIRSEDAIAVTPVDIRALTDLLTHLRRAVS